MGYSLVAAAAVVFLAGFVAAFKLTDVTTSSAQQVDQAWQEAQQRSLHALRSQAEVTSATSDAGTLTVVVRNTGATAIDAGKVDLLVDGEPVALLSRLVEGAASSVWAPGQDLTLTAAGGDPASVSVAGPDGTLAAWRA